MTQNTTQRVAQPAAVVKILLFFFAHLYNPFFNDKGGNYYCRCKQQIQLVETRRILLFCKKKEKEKSLAKTQTVATSEKLCK